MTARKRVFSFFMALLMVLTMMPLTAGAVRAEDEVTLYIGVYSRENGYGMDGTCTFDDEDMFFTYGERSVAVGTAVPLTAAAQEGFEFIGWYTGTKNSEWEEIDPSDELISGESSFNYTVTGDAALVAVFQRKDENADRTVIAGVYDKTSGTAGTGGSFMSSGDCISRTYGEYSVSLGMTLELLAGPDVMYEFLGWYKATKGPDGSIVPTDECICESSVLIYFPEADSVVCAVFKALGMEPPETGKCGEGVSYELDLNTGRLFIQGTGAMYDYSEENASPFAAREEIKYISVESGVTHIGDSAFRDCKNLDGISVAGGVQTFGKGVFDGCTSIFEIDLPDSLTKVEFGSFAGSGIISKSGVINYAGSKSQWKEICAENEGLYPASYGACDVTFAPGEGTGDEFIKVVRKYDNLTLPDNNFEAPDGKIFGCWGVGDPMLENYSLMAPGEVLAVEDDVRIVAQWDELTSIEGEVVGLSMKSFTYNGKVQRPTIKTIGGRTLIAGTDYMVTWSNKKSKNAGTYSLTVTGKGKFTGQTTATYRIKKAANPLSIKGRKATVSYKALLKANQTLTVGKVIKFVAKGRGTMTYTKVSGNKKITVNSRTGKVTVKKGLKKGTYKVKIKVRAAGTSNYKAVTKTVTVRIVVK